MSVISVVGAQWGDEGKGKVVDLLSEKAEVVVRTGGGANAGHTLVLNGQKLVTHLIPSGVLHKGTQCVLGEGMVIDPLVLVEEIEHCQSMGLLSQNELVIGDGAHVIFPYHKIIEGLREERLIKDDSKEAIGTTRRGIGPTYEAKAARRGIRIGDLANPQKVKELVEENLFELSALIAHYGGTVPNDDVIQSWLADAGRAFDKFSQWVGDASFAVNKAIKEKKNVLLEGAQGALLDIDHGTYPFVTSSSTISSGACQGVGVGPNQVDKVLGITKAYCTRVGGGPFPSEMNAKEGEEWRQAGAEFGATTGRPRRCGWLDVAALKKVGRLCGITSWALTKLDIVGGRGPLKVCVGYKKDGVVLDELPKDPSGYEPVFETLETWGELPQNLSSKSELPKAAQNYLAKVEEWTEIPIDLVSVGADRNQTISVNELYT